MRILLENVSNFLLKIQKGIMIVSSILILVGLVATVFLRYVFQADLYGLGELIIIPAFWMYFIGASYGTYNNSHITADITKVYIKSERNKAFIKLFGSIISFIISIVFAYWATIFIQWTIQSEATSSAWNYPLYIPQSAILVGFLLITLYTLVSVVNDFSHIIKLNK